jgi:hypothetical protein
MLVMRLTVAGLPGALRAWTHRFIWGHLRLKDENKKMNRIKQRVFI